MRGVPERVIASLSFLALQERDLLRWTFFDPECGLSGEAGILFRGLRLERDAMLSRGLFNFLSLVEDAANVRLSSYQKANSNMSDVRRSSLLLQDYVKAESLGSIIWMLLQTTLDLSLLSRSIYRGIRISTPDVRKSLWKEYRVVDRAFRDLLRSDIFLYAPNSRTGRKMPQNAVWSLASLVKSERSVIVKFMSAASADSRARDSLFLLRYSPLLTGFGRIKNSHFLGVEDLAHIFESPHSRHRRAFLADILSHVHMLSSEEVKLRYALANRDGDQKALRLASDVLSVHVHSVIRSLDELVAENGLEH